MAVGTAVEIDVTETEPYILIRYNPWGTKIDDIHRISLQELSDVIQDREPDESFFNFPRDRLTRHMSDLVKPYNIQMIKTFEQEITKRGLDSAKFIADARTAINGIRLIYRLPRL